MSYQELKKEILINPSSLNKIVDLLEFSPDSSNEAYTHLNCVQDIIHSCYLRYVVENSLSTKSTEAMTLKKWMQKQYWNFYDILASRLFFCFENPELNVTFSKNENPKSLMKSEENFEQLKYKYLELWMKEWKFLFGHILVEISDFKRLERLSQVKIWKREFFENDALMDWLITVVLEQYCDIWLLWIITLKTYVSVEHSNLNQLKHVLNFMVDMKVPLPGSHGCKFLSSNHIHLEFKKSEKYIDSFVALWMEILRRSDLDQSIQKHILNRLHIDIIPYFKNRAHLLNPFIEFTFKNGGESALLSVQSLYILMTKHGLVVNNFYEKLYHLIHPSIFEFPDQVGEFLDFLEAALSSPLITENIVISFAKKISRVALASPCYSIIYWTRLLSLLLYKYPYLRILVHKEDALFDKIQNLGRYQLLKLYKEGKLQTYLPNDIALNSKNQTNNLIHTNQINMNQDINNYFDVTQFNEEESRRIFTLLLDSKPQLNSEDPFVETENNLELANAPKSSLWEIETLKSHPFKLVSKECKSVRATLRNRLNEIKPNTKDLKADPSYDSLFLQLIHVDDTSTNFRKNIQFHLSCFRE